MQRHTVTEMVNHSRSTALERLIKTLLGGGAKIDFTGGGGGAQIDFTWPQPSPLVLPVFWEKKRNIDLSSAEFAQRVVKVKELRYPYISDCIRKRGLTESSLFIHALPWQFFPVHYLLFKCIENFTTKKGKFSDKRF